MSGAEDEQAAPAFADAEATGYFGAWGPTAGQVVWRKRWPESRYSEEAVRFGEELSNDEAIELALGVSTN